MGGAARTLRDRLSPPDYYRMPVSVIGGGGLVGSFDTRLRFLLLHPGLIMSFIRSSSTVALPMHESLT